MTVRERKRVTTTRYPCSITIQRATMTTTSSTQDRCSTKSKWEVDKEMTIQITRNVRNIAKDSDMYGLHDHKASRITFRLEYQRSL